MNIVINGLIILAIVVFLMELYHYFKNRDSSLAAGYNVHLIADNIFIVISILFAIFLLLLAAVIKFVW
jgi:hypothetical protein